MPFVFCYQNNNINKQLQTQNTPQNTTFYFIFYFYKYVLFQCQNILTKQVFHFCKSE